MVARGVDHDNLEARAGRRRDEALALRAGRCRLGADLAVRRRGAEEGPVARCGVGVGELRDRSTVDEDVGAQASRVDGHFLSSHVLV